MLWLLFLRFLCQKNGFPIDNSGKSGYNSGTSETGANMSPETGEKK